MERRGEERGMGGRGEEGVGKRGSRGKNVNVMDVQAKVI